MLIKNKMPYKLESWNSRPSETIHIEGDSIEIDLFNKKISLIQSETNSKIDMIFNDFVTNERGDEILIFTNNIKRYIGNLLVFESVVRNILVLKKDQEIKITNQPDKFNNMELLSMYGFGYTYDIITTIENGFSELIEITEKGIKNPNVIKSVLGDIIENMIVSFSNVGCFYNVNLYLNTIKYLINECKFTNKKEIMLSILSEFFNKLLTLLKDFNYKVGNLDVINDKVGSINSTTIDEYYLEDLTTEYQKSIDLLMQETLDTIKMLSGIENNTSLRELKKEED